MKKRQNNFYTKAISGEAGQALILVLIFLLLGSLTLVPALSHVSTALKTGVAYEDKTSELFTADAGIEEGMWRIKYDVLGPSYDIYDYDSEWSYETETVNNRTADLIIQNVWIPSNVTLDSLGLTPAEARSIIESEKLVITGTAGAIPGQPYHIKIDFTPAEGDNLTIKSIGVYLPQGFTYEASSSNLEADPFADYYPDSVVVTTVPGGQTVVWSYNTPYPLFATFPDVDPGAETMTTDITFDYNPPADDPNKMPVGIAWVTTDMEPTCPNPNDVPIAWDTDTRIYKLTSDTGVTQIQAYSSKCQLRNLGGAIAGDYVAIGNSLMLDNYSPFDRRDTLLSSSSTNVCDVSAIPDDGDVLYAFLYWSGWRSESDKVTVFSDTCTNLNSWDTATPSSWSVASSSYLKGHYSSGGAAARLLTLKTAQDLSTYVPGSAIVTWEQSIPPALSDSCSSIGAYWTNGGAWSENSNRFRSRSSAAAGDPARLLTLTSPLDLSYVTLKDVTISWDQWEDGTLGAGDGLDFAISTDNGSTWQTNIQAFRDDISGTQNYSCPIPSSNLTSAFKMRLQVVGFTGSAYCYVDNIKITSTCSSTDGLDFAISADSGSTWSSNIQAFRGDIGSSAVRYDYYIPGEYTTSGFKIRFQLVGMDGPGAACKIDNIKIQDLPPDTAISFYINGQQVYLDANGDPQAGASPLNYDTSRVLLNYLSSTPTGYSYACYQDVSRLVQTYPIVPGEEHHTGNYNYTIGSVDADVGEYISYAGWSLIIIYSSPSTAGRYIFLRDTRELFAFNSGSTNLDFDNDGTGGGDITGFLFPEPVRDKYGAILYPQAAKITCFVGEGDSYTGDTLVITGQQSGDSASLSNASSPANNVWNSASPGMSYPGVDVDTFEVLWEDGILTPKDTELHLDMNSGTDAWNLIYIILSVRSETVTRGTEHYVIQSN